MNHRLYSFVNKLYMSPIQLGIQTAHAVSTLMAKTQRAMLAGEDAAGTNERTMLWATESPTIMVCEGGNVGMLLSLEARLGALADRMGLPWASFREDEESLGGVITAVCALIPDDISNLRATTTDEGALVFIARPDSEVDFSGLPGGLPVSAESNPVLHELASIVVLARLA
jgi:hypothetical protein